MDKRELLNLIEKGENQKLEFKENVEYTEKEGSITNKEYQRLNNITKRTATRDMKDLVQKGIFRIIGKGKRELKYILILRQNVPKNVPKKRINVKKCQKRG